MNRLDAEENSIDDHSNVDFTFGQLQSIDGKISNDFGADKTN
jgi:hypothetical protein